MHTISPNPLVAHRLDAEQMRLLRLIARPVLEPGRIAEAPGSAPQWPPWRWVSRTFHRERGDATGNADDVFLSLPTVPRTWTGPGDLGRPYGLVRREHSAPSTPIATERVGLTIAGLKRLSSTGVGGRIPDLPDRLVQLLVTLDDFEMRELEPTLDVEQPGHDVLLSRFDVQLVDTAHGGLGDEVVCALLMGEFFGAPGLFLQQTDPVADNGAVELARSTAWARLGNEALKRYRGLTDVDDYLARVWDSVGASGAAASPGPVDLSRLPGSTFPHQAWPAEPATSAAPPTAAPIARDLELHERVAAAVADAWGAGLYALATFAAFRDLEHRVTTIAREQGWNPKHYLDVFASSSQEPLLDTSRGAGSNQQDERAGFHALIRGAMSAIRNPRAHGEQPPDTAVEAAEYLALASLLHRRIDVAERRVTTDEASL